VTKLYSPALLLSQVEANAHDPVVVAALVAELRAAIEDQHNDPIERLKLPVEVHLDRIVPIAIAAKLRGCSVSTLMRHFRQYVIAIGPGKTGMRIRHVLSLEDPPRQSRSRASMLPKRRRGHGDAEQAEAP
jgi:hypothetical protein